MDMQKRIETVLEEMVRPTLRRYGGGVSLDSCCDGVVTFVFLGACSGCPFADRNTKDFIETMLCIAVPEVRRVEVAHPTAPELLDFARRLLQNDSGRYVVR